MKRTTATFSFNFTRVDPEMEAADVIKMEEWVFALVWVTVGWSLGTVYKTWRDRQTRTRLSAPWKTNFVETATA